MSGPAGTARASRMRRRRRLDVHAADRPARRSPWKTDDLVDPANPHYGRYGDTRWTFGAQNPNHSPGMFDMDWKHGGTGLWPTPEWVTVGRDFAMSLYGRRPGRGKRSGDGSKLVTVSSRVYRLAVVARWSHANGFGLPLSWDSHVAEHLAEDWRAGKIATKNQRGASRTDRGLADLLVTIQLLWEHRERIAYGPVAEPWPDLASVSAKDFVGTVTDPYLATEVLDPPVWWAIVRTAMRFVFVYGPDIARAWQELRQGGKPLAPTRVPRLQRLHAWAESGADVPVDAEGNPVFSHVARAAGVSDTAVLLRSRTGVECRALIADVVAAGRTTRVHFGKVSDVLWPDGSRQPWTSHLDAFWVTQLASRLRDSGWLLLLTFCLMRDSEVQGLRRGCVRRHNDGYVLAGEIYKGKAPPAAATWPIDNLLVRVVQILEELGDVVDVTEIVGGRTVPSDRLFWKVPGRLGQAGIGAADHVLRRYIDWCNEHADELALPRAYPEDPSRPAIPVQVNSHQFRVTGAAVLAMHPDGPLGARRVLHDTMSVAMAYMANPDDRWLDVQRQTSRQVRLRRLRRYMREGDAESLVGPGAGGLRDDLMVVRDDVDLLVDDGDDPTVAERLFELAGHQFAAGNLHHCAGLPRERRCAAITAELAPDAPFEPGMGMGMAMDVCLSNGPDGDCGSVVFDPPEHLPVWDVVHAQESAELQDLTDAPGTAARHGELVRSVIQAASRIAAMEKAMLARPGPALIVLRRELERYLDYILLEPDIPGACFAYRELYLAAKARIHWLVSKTPPPQRPRWSIPAITGREPLWVTDPTLAYKEDECLD